MKEKRKHLKGTSNILSSVKEKKFPPLFFRVDILGLCSKIFLFCVAWLFNPD